MKAILLPKHGGPEVLTLDETSRPLPKNNQVLVQLEYAALNHIDIWVRSGDPAYPIGLPHIMGSDGAGIVVEVGPEAEGINIGNRVTILPAISCGVCEYCRKGFDNQCQQFEILGSKRSGTYAEFALVPDQNVLAIPDQISFAEAAAYPLAYLTAWHMLIGRAKLQPNEKVLIVGASSGVAVAGIQIAKSRGAHVFAVTSKEEKVPKLKSLGADHIFVQSEKTDFSKWAIEQTKGAGVEVVFEHVGPATWEKSMKCLGKYGRLVTCGATTGPKVELGLRSLFGRDISILGARMGTQKEFVELSNKIFQGKIKPVVDKIFPLKEASEAHKYLESGQHFGKVLLKIK